MIRKRSKNPPTGPEKKDGIGPRFSCSQPHICLFPKGERCLIILENSFNCFDASSFFSNSFSFLSTSIPGKPTYDSGIIKEHTASSESESPTVVLFSSCRKRSIALPIESPAVTKQKQ